MSAANTYFDTLQALLDRTRRTQAQAVEEAARHVANSLKNGGMIYTFGTGHGHLLALEVFYRAGGLARICPILDDKLMLHVSAACSSHEERREDWTQPLLERFPMKAGDVLFAISNSGRNAAPVLLAKEAQKRGVYVIALTSKTHSGSVTARNSLNLRLFEVADLVLDNGGVLGDAAVPFSDGSFVGPTSTAIGAALLQAIVCRVKEISLEEGFDVDFYKSSNVDGGDEWNDRLIAKYGKIIPGLRYPHVAPFMRAGLGQSELTPPLGVELAGFGYYLHRCAESVRDPLFARALMIEESATRALVISCDLLGLSQEVCEKVFEHAEAAGIPRDHVILVSIHTHTGPAIKYHEGCGYTDSAYLSTVAPAICRAVDLALADLEQVTSLRFISAPFEGDHIYNRTIPDGPVDRFARGFFFTRKSRPTIAAVSAACHGVFRGRSTAVSADFAGEICRLMENKGMRPIYLNGLCGDIDPSKMDDGLLDSFAKLVTDRLSGDSVPLPLTLSGGTLPFSLRLMPVTREDIHKAAAMAVERAGGEDKPAARVALIWEKEMLERFDCLREEEAVTIKYLLVGGVPLLALPFEGYTQIGIDIRNQCGRKDAMILGCAEELLGYLPTKDDISRGTYAALESTFLYKRLPVVPGEAERLGETVGNAMASILSSDSA